MCRVGVVIVGVFVYELYVCLCESVCESVCDCAGVMMMVGDVCVQSWSGDNCRRVCVIIVGVFV